MLAKILVATDGKPGALGALRLARRLAERDGARVEVLAVFESTDLYAVGSPHAVASLPPHYLPGALDALRERVRAQLADVGAGAADWAVTVEMGSVASGIARAAVERDADAVLLGLRRPGAVERWLARETLLRVVHLASVPVIAVPEETGEPPRKVVLAVDFSDFSARAARAVLDVAAPGAQLHLVHVSTLPTREDGRTGSDEWREWERTYLAGVQARLDELSGRLAEDGGATVTTHLLAGDPGTEILRLAEELDADLIAAGSHGAGFIGRVVVGSVSSKLVHGARCSLVVAPPPAVAPELHLDLTEREVLAELGTAGELALPEARLPE